MNRTAGITGIVMRSQSTAANSQQQQHKQHKQGVAENSTKSMVNTNSYSQTQPIHCVTRIRVSMDFFN